MFSDAMNSSHHVVPGTAFAPYRVAKHVLCTILIFGLLAYSALLFANWQQPLNKSEVDAAAAIALAGHTVTTTKQTESPGKSVESAFTAFRRSSISNNHSHPLGTQILLIELQEQKKQSLQRLAEVFLFDYQRGVTERKLVDVESKLLVDSRDIASVHLPLSQTEIRYSTELIWSNSEINQRVRDEMIASGAGMEHGGLAGDVSRLLTKVSIWVPDNPGQAGVSQCDSQRCALISIFTLDNYNFSVEPVVNLMSGDIFVDILQ